MPYSLGDLKRDPILESQPYKEATGIVVLFWTFLILIMVQYTPGPILILKALIYICTLIVTLKGPLERSPIPIIKAPGVGSRAALQTS